MRFVHTLAVPLAFLLTGFSGAEAQARWEVSEDPTLVIGDVDGPSYVTFHAIKGAVAANDSVVVVADGAARQLRVFSFSGEFLGAFGRDGDGPEEFRGISWIDMCGGTTVVVYDFVRYRITKWHPDGVLVEGFSVEGPDGPNGLPPNSVSCGPRGEYSVVGWPDFLGYSGGVGPYRSDVKVGRLDRKGRLVEVIGVYPGSERYRYTSSDGPRPLGKTTVSRMGADGVYVGSADSFEIQVVGSQGEQRTFGLPTPNSPLTRDLIRVWTDSIIQATSTENRPRARRVLNSYVLPTNLPAYSDFRLDRLGFVWVARYGPPGVKVTEWEVFDPQGEWVATVPIPIRFRLTEIGEDYLLGVDTDHIGVERVHLYELRR